MMLMPQELANLAPRALSGKNLSREGGEGKGGEGRREERGGEGREGRGGEGRRGKKRGEGRGRKGREGRGGEERGGGGEGWRRWRENVNPRYPQQGASSP